MRTYKQFLENIDQRRAALAQRQRETLARSQERGSQVSSDASQRLAAQQAKNDEDNLDMSSLNFQRLFRVM